MDLVQCPHPEVQVCFGFGFAVANGEEETFQHNDVTTHRPFGTEEKIISR